MADGSLGIGSLRRPDGAPTRTSRPAAPAPPPDRAPSGGRPSGRSASVPPPSGPAPSGPAPSGPAPSGPASTPPTGTLVDLLFTRHSISDLTEPGPTDAEVDTLLRAATTVPDHGGLRPWRFGVVRGAGRARFGDALAAAAQAAGAPADSLDGVRGKAMKAPVLVVVIAAPKVDSKIPEWEQMTSASAAGYAITLAAHALGIGAAWRSTEHMEGAAVRQLFGMAATDRVLGWVLLGTPAGDAPQEARDTPDLTDLVTRVE